MKNNYFITAKSTKPILFFIGLFLSSVSFQMSATTLVVNSVQDGNQSEVETLAAGGYITFRYALQYATRDIVTFDASLAGQSITLTSGQITITTAVAIDGETNNITIDANQTDRILNVTDGNTANAIPVSIKNLTFKNGKCTITGNGGGGAILNEENLSLEHCTFDNNSAGASTYSGGGAILMTKVTATDAQVNVNACLFKNNSLTRGWSKSGGGAIGAACFGTTGKVKIIVRNSVFIGNTSIANGGAVAIYYDGTCILLNNTFINNHADKYNQSDVYGDSAGGGGAVYSYTSKFTLGGNLFLGNTAGTGDNLGTNDVHARGTSSHVLTDLGYNIYQANITNSGDAASTIPTFVWSTVNKQTSSSISDILTLNTGVTGGYELTVAGNAETRIVPQSFIDDNSLTIDIADKSRNDSSYYNSGAKECNWVLNSDKSDEFNEWNPEKWGTTLWYTTTTDLAFNSGNVSVSSGYLRLLVKKENYIGKEYTCGAVKSKFTIGANTMMEIRAKTIDYRANVPTAIWLSDKPVPENNPNVEIDIMETLSPNSKPRKFTAGLHYWWSGGIGDQSLGWKDYLLPLGQNMSDSFHIYRLERYNGRLRFYFDGNLFWDYDTTDYPRLNDMERYFIFSIEGHADSAYLPAEYLIDYIRIYDYVDATVAEQISLYNNINEKSDVKISNSRDNLNFYPNPAKDMLYFERETPQLVELLSLQGIILQSWQNVKNINISQHPAGIYLIKTNNKAMYKMIKTKQ